MQVISILVGVITVIANIWIARYNAGKNRIIYGTEVATISMDRKQSIEELNGKLSAGEYAILTTIQDKADGYSQTFKYILGKIKK